MSGFILSSNINSQEKSKKSNIRKSTKSRPLGMVGSISHVPEFHRNGTDMGGTSRRGIDLALLRISRWEAVGFHQTGVCQRALYFTGALSFFSRAVCVFHFPLIHYITSDDAYFRAKSLMRTVSSAGVGSHTGLCPAKAGKDRRKRWLFRTGGW